MPDHTKTERAKKGNKTKKSRKLATRPKPTKKGTKKR